MYYSQSDMIESVVRAQKSTRTSMFIITVVFSLASIALFFIVSAWWAIVLGVILSLLALICVGTGFAHHGYIEKFKKYAPFYDRGDVFLSQIVATQIAPHTIRKELNALVSGKVLENVVFLEETGQILIASSRSKEQAELFLKYEPFYNKEEISFADIESHLNASIDVIWKELQELVCFGAIELPIIDETNRTLVILTLDPKKAQGKTGDEAIDALLQEGENAVATLRDLRDSIPDAQTQEKIDEIITITEAIFKRLLSAPDSYNQVRRFANQYLPKALKLLTSYERFKDSRVQGETISSMLEQINAALDPLASGFKRIYDSLYKRQVLDIETDIKVLELMLKRDGFHEHRD